MKIIKINEAGYIDALEGLSLSYRQAVEDMLPVAERLAHSKRGSERKFMRQIVVWLLITAPEYWWTQFDTYKVGVVRQSSSTMHKLMSRPLTPNDFAASVDQRCIDAVNECIASKDFDAAIANLPRGYLYDSVVSLNYEVLRTIILDRQHHKLPEWHEFIEQIRTQVQHPELLPCT